MPCRRARRCPRRIRDERRSALSRDAVTSWPVRPSHVEGLLPGFDGATGWLNSEPLTPEALVNLRSPETYLGYGQARSFASPGPPGLDESRDYAVPDDLRLNQRALAGEWAIERGASVLTGSEGSLAFRFHARDVNLVLGPPARGRMSVPFRVTVGDQVRRVRRRGVRVHVRLDRVRPRAGLARRARACGTRSSGAPRPCAR
jgi:Thioredoxin like C-terminal domain